MWRCLRAAGLVPHGAARRRASLPCDSPAGLPPRRMHRQWRARDCASCWAAAGKGLFPSASWEGRARCHAAAALDFRQQKEGLSASPRRRPASPSRAVPGWGGGSAAGGYRHGSTRRLPSRGADRQRSPTRAPHTVSSERRRRSGPARLPLRSPRTRRLQVKRAPGAATFRPRLLPAVKDGTGCGGAACPALLPADLSTQPPLPRGSWRRRALRALPPPQHGQQLPRRYED